MRNHDRFRTTSDRTFPNGRVKHRLEMTQTHVKFHTVQHFVVIRVEIRVRFERLVGAVILLGKQLLARAKTLIDCVVVVELGRDRYGKESRAERAPKRERGMPS